MREIICTHVQLTRRPLERELETTVELASLCASKRASQGDYQSFACSEGSLDDPTDTNLQNLLQRQPAANGSTRPSVMSTHLRLSTTMSAHLERADGHDGASRPTVPHVTLQASMNSIPHGPTTRLTSFSGDNTAAAAQAPNDARGGSLRSVLRDNGNCSRAMRTSSRQAAESSTIAFQEGSRSRLEKERAGGCEFRPKKSDPYPLCAPVSHP